MMTRNDVYFRGQGVDEHNASGIVREDLVRVYR